MIGPFKENDRYIFYEASHINKYLYYILMIRSKEIKNKH